MKKTPYCNCKLFAHKSYLHTANVATHKFNLWWIVYYTVSKLCKLNICSTNSILGINNTKLK